MVLSACLLMAGQAMAAGTPAGSTVSNQAYADYSDANGNSRPRVFSDPVTTEVSQIAVVDVTPPTATRNEAKGTTADFGAEVTNEGNGTDVFDLSVATCPGWTATIYLDDNQNGVRDPGEDTVVADTGALAADAGFWVVIQVTSPIGSVNGDTCDTTLTAQSQFNGGVSDTGVFTTVVQDAVLTVVKSVSPSTGVIPGDIVTFAITGTNSGTATAEDVVITDEIPANSTYVANSIRLGPVGGDYATAAPQTDAADGPGVDNADYNVTNPGEITVSWGNSDAGDSGVIYFQVQINAGVAAGTHVENTADVNYKVGGLAQPALTSTTAQVIVASDPSVDVSTTDTAETGDPGDEIVYPITVCNTGNTSDVFDITVNSSLGWTWVIWVDNDGNGVPGTDGDYVAVDTDGDNVIDAGTMAQGACRDLLAVATIPPGSADQSQDVLTVTATSSVDPNVSDSQGFTTTVTAPLLSITKTVSPAGAQPPGTELTYTITVTNNGTGTATAVIINDLIPNFTTYKLTSIRSGATTASLVGRTDNRDGDGGEFNSGTNSVVAPDGGAISLGSGGTWVLEFKVLID